MYIDRKWLYVNVFALTLNALFLCLAVFKVCPAILPIAAFVVCLAGCILLSAKANGLTFRQRYPFHSAPTERVATFHKEERAGL